MGVPTVHADSTGENVTVAVIDLGFNASNPEIADNVVETTTMRRNQAFINRSDQHGTAVAEVATDTAPNVSLILISVNTVIEMKKAVSYVNQNTSADLVTMSLGVYVGPFDGTSKLDDLIAESTRNGTPYFISAGNAGNGKHLHTDWNDSDGDRFLDFPSGDDRLNITTRADTIKLFVSWREFPSSDNDYDLGLYDGDGELVAISNNRQAGGVVDRPIEVISHSSLGNPPYSLGIYNSSASGNATFDIFANDGTWLEYSTRSQSITRPATEETAFTIAATYHQDNTLEPYSSRGPTIDGRRKPTMSAPDRVSTAVYGEQGFYGTSAAAPHAAGVAALMLEANESLSPATLKGTLTRTADPIYGTEPNNETGFGLVNATAAVPLPSENPSPTVETTLESSTNNVGSPITIGVRAADADGNVANLSLQTGSGIVLDQVNCGNATCSTTLSTTPTEASWNGTEYVKRTYRVVVVDDSGTTALDTVSTSVYIEGDATGDGVVDIFDAVAVGRSWQTKRGSPGYSDAADLTNDGVVDIFDAVVVGRNWQVEAS
jgi:subtilisin family serine protease